MTIGPVPEPPENPVIEGLRSLEVRWILPGLLEPAVADWFGRFPAEVAARQDAYLVDPELPGLSVKVRAGVALEVKVYHGSPGTVDISGRAVGRTESWQKWSFPLTSFSLDSGALAGWRLIRKRRRIIRFLLAGERVVAAVSEPATEPRCAVELTEIGVGGEVYWSLGFEATGPGELLGSVLRDSAALLFAQAPPGQVDLDMNCCQSYAQWLSRQREPRVMTRCAL
jgi:hypothetical protein